MVKMILKIDGMACGMCESHVNDTIRRNFDVKKVNSSHSKGETEILAENPLDEEALKKAIGDTGYTLQSVRTEPYVKKGLFRR
ncbi:MAG: heavy-metal-associated domain-containing protein [Acutalibacteraceae bacterium]